MERFLKLKKCLPIACGVIRSNETIYLKEWEILKDISKFLYTFVIALMGICSREEMLLPAKTSYKVLGQKEAFL